MSATIPSMPRKAWWCPTCDQVTFEKVAGDREDAHVTGWGADGIARCPGRWQRVTMHRGHVPVEPITVHTHTSPRV